MLGTGGKVSPGECAGDVSYKDASKAVCMCEGADGKGKTGAKRKRASAGG